MEKVAFDPTSLDLPEHPCVELDLADAAATAALGRALARTLAAGDFVGLVGNLGAGKTTLVQGLVRELDPDAEATSPTYTLLHHHETTPPVIHVDLYRLETYDELESIGYWDYVESDAAITCVEWVDQVPEAWPRHSRCVLVELLHRDGARQARIFWPKSSSRPDLQDALRALQS